MYRQDDSEEFSTLFLHTKGNPEFIKQLTTNSPVRAVAKYKPAGEKRKNAEVNTTTDATPDLVQTVGVKEKLIGIQH